MEQRRCQLMREVALKMNRIKPLSITSTLTAINECAASINEIQTSSQITCYRCKSKGNKAADCATPITAQNSQRSYTQKQFNRQQTYNNPNSSNNRYNAKRLRQQQQTTEPMRPTRAEVAPVNLS
ncbi:unnamed protein product [Didymodactylos carnosus]|uniref:CCHC-type domain-containing protein n=1 Tax=Didymodactylos carnosus TaxID=1234261 RepID=A0A8S2FLQ7_9BILA|nr:unnamed protein product [Didymodactylos carnosus]CAF4281218.1 unnamed protein product [Didymodactylos carnosus]